MRTAKLESFLSKIFIKITINSQKIKDNKDQQKKYIERNKLKDLKGGHKLKVRMRKLTKLHQKPHIIMHK